MEKKINVRKHKRLDPRIKKKVDVGSYDRRSKVKKYTKSTNPVKDLYGITSDYEKRQIYNSSFIEDNKRLDMVLHNVDPKSRKIIIDEYEKSEAKTKTIEAIYQERIKTLNEIIKKLKKRSERNG